MAEYKRPQFEASGNMQQGLYVPLAHVWQNLYDPLHVLLRAVHRRDFQSSMDRYTTLYVGVQFNCFLLHCSIILMLHFYV